MSEESYDTLVLLQDVAEHALPDSVPPPADLREEDVEVDAALEVRGLVAPGDAAQRGLDLEDLY